ncbi:hypothetical protein KBI23_14650 [bacterium]|nr:hypothetical protein [bacterium]MBP9808000.1 hypothetical protein [bacterium]
MPARFCVGGAALALSVAALPLLMELSFQQSSSQEFFALAAQAQEKATFKLSGGISHSDSLEPLPVSERVGAALGGNAGATVPSNIPPSNTPPANTPPALVNPYRNSNASSGITPAVTSPVRMQPQVPPPNQLYYSRTPHIDPGQALYRKRLREAAEQNLLATTPRRPTRVQIKVPFWLAGQWQRTETNELSRKELPSGKELKAVGKQVARVTDVFGTYKDRRGNVFMIVPLGAGGAVDRGFAVDYHRVKKYEMILDGKNSAVIKVQASHQVVSKKDKRVVEAYQDEELNRYTLIRDGLVKNDSSVKVFDQLGQPKLITRAVSTERRVKRI